MRWLCGMLLVSCAAVQTAASQRLHGTVRDAVSGVPVPGVVLWLADTAGLPLARAIGDEAGRFNIQRTSRAAVVRLSRIGYSPAEVPLPGSASDTTLDLRMQPLPTRLAGLAASTQRVCPSDARGSDGLALWEQARAALLAGLVAREAQPPRVRLVSFTRTRDPVLHRMVHSQSTVKEVVVDRSYVAAMPAWEFAAKGYMRELGGDQREFYAPDNETLLDATFVTTHCLAVAPADRDHGDQVGIAFEPAPSAERDTIVDVRGVLWMDRERPALRSIDFSYTNLEGAAAGSGGTITFVAMKNGAPMVSRWTIHTMELVADPDPRGAVIQRQPLPRRLRNNVRKVGEREMGGEVASITWPDGTVWHAPLPRIIGQVLDDEGRPVPGARVWLMNTSDTVTTTADGHFALPYVVAGAYAVLASDSVLAEAGIARTPKNWVMLSKPADASITVPMRSRGEVLGIVCEGQSYQPGRAVVLGRVLDTAGAPKPFARIELFRHIMMGNAELFRQDPGGVAGEDGRFVICGATPSEQLRIRAAIAGEAGEVTVKDWQDNVTWAKLVLRPVPDGASASASRPRAAAP